MSNMNKLLGVDPDLETEAKEFLRFELGWTDDDFEDVGMIYGHPVAALMASFHHHMKTRVMQ